MIPDPGSRPSQLRYCVGPNHIDAEKKQQLYPVTVSSFGDIKLVEDRNQITEVVW